jgi:hypothetical protein
VYITAANEQRMKEGLVIQQNVRPEQVQYFSLISAIIGGFVTAVLTYIIHLLLVRRNEKKRQRQLALLYLTRISTIVATKKVVESVLKENSAFKEIIEKLRGLKEKEKMGPVFHMISVAMVEALQNKSTVDNSKILEVFYGPLMKKAFNLIKKLVGDDKYFGFKIDDEILSGLPSATMLQYNFFISRISGIHQALSDWILAYESKDFSLLDADDLYLQAANFKRVLDDAENLRASLIKKAKVKRKEADRILQEQFKYYAKETAVFEKDKKIIGILKEIIEKRSQNKEAQIGEK